MNQVIKKSIIGLSNENEIYNDNFVTYLDITNKISKYFQDSGGLEISPHSTDNNKEDQNFDLRIRNILNQELDVLDKYVKENNFAGLVKLYIEVYDNEKKELIEKDYIIGNWGWRKKDANNNVFEGSDNSEDTISIGRSLAWSAWERTKELGKAASAKAGELLGKAEKTISGTAPEAASSDVIIYNEHNSERVRQLQRCLIRTAPNGNLKKERESASGYTPVVGIRKKGSGNYADDGWFGPETLKAVATYKGTLNSLNKFDTQIPQITNEREIPVSILTSPACSGKTGEELTKKEQEDLKAPAPSPPPAVGPGQPAAGIPVKESKVYKEFSFLSAKNSRLHSVLMEQLKKDLKRG